MKRFTTVIFALLLIASVATASIIAISLLTDEVYLLGKPLRPDKGDYVDYAKEVKFDYEKDPELKEMGMFWVSFDEEGNQIQTPAESEEARSIVDPNKPTMIAIHGMMSDGHYARERYFLGYEADYADFGVDLNVATNAPEAVSMAYIWINKGWNFAFYHYENFASEGASFADIEQKVWSWVEKGEEADSPGREVRYKKENGEFVYNPSKYSVGEHFAADYIRAMDNLPDSMGDKEIRIAAHSMGGQVAAAGLFLLTELSHKKIKQIDPKKLPTRYALMDTFFSAYAPIKGKWTNLSSYAIEGFDIRWSGKPHVNNTTGHSIALILEILYKRGILLEYYTEPASFLSVALPPEILDAIHTYCSTVTIMPYWEEGNPGYSRSGAHNGVREWYLCSFASSLPRLEGSVDERTPSAAMSDEDLRKCIGKQYTQVAGENDLVTTNDIFAYVE